MVAPWEQAAAGVLEFPSGRRVRGRALSRPLPAGPLPDVGLYLLGTALACLAVLDGVPAAAAVAFVRERYDPRAVEVPWQRWYVARFALTGLPGIA